MKIEHREKLKVSTKSVHAATIEIWDNHPVFSWFGGTREGSQDTCIYLHNLKNKQETITIGFDDVIPRWNPILVNIGSDLLLFEKAGFFCDRWQTFIHNVSKWDEGITKKEIYQNRKVLPAGLNGPVKSRPLIKGNRMYCGSSFETLYDWSSYIEEYIIEGSDIIFDVRSNPIIEPIKKTYSNHRSGRTETSLGLIQPTLCELNGYMFALMRSSGGLERIYYVSRQMGLDWEYWDSAIKTNLPNPNSAVDVVSYDGSIYLIWNPDERNRFPLVLSKIKMKNRLKSEVEFEIEDSILISDELNDQNFIEKGCISPELSYPYMVENDGNLHIVYTRGRNSIEYCIVKL